MTEVLLFVNIGLLVIGSVTLTIAIFVLQRARGYVEMAEERMERLREVQEQIFLFMREERRLRREGSTPEQNETLEPHQETVESEVSQTEPQRLRHRRENKVPQQAGSSRSEDSSEKPPQGVGLLTPASPEAGRSLGADKMPATKKPDELELAAQIQEVKEGKRPRLAVRHAHPDDDVGFRRNGAKQDGSQGDAPVKMFREHYRRYLENYEGYVKLAERLYSTREGGEVPVGSPAESEWGQKLRRLKDGIQRTTARLDILEQYNPELASDDSVSHRAEISRSYSQLEEKLSVLENS